MPSLRRFYSRVEFSGHSGLGRSVAGAITDRRRQPAYMHQRARDQVADAEFGRVHAAQTHRRQAGALNASADPPHADDVSPLALERLTTLTKLFELREKRIMGPM